MGFLRRLLGGNQGSDQAEAPPNDPTETVASDGERELDVLRAEQERLDELAQRQLRFAHHAWQPPAQGGDRRAEDED